MLGANLKRGHSHTVLFVGRGFLPHPGALLLKLKTAWAWSAFMPHIIHAEGGRGGAEGMPDQLKYTNKEEATDQALAHRRGFCPDGGANR